MSTALAPYIPRKQADFTNWLANFSTLITASPTLYGLTSGDATIIAGLNTQWVAAFTPVTSPTSKTAAAVSAKNTAYATIVPQIRTYAQAISNNPGVGSADKIAVGVNPKTSTPSPISPPASVPVLTIQAAGPGTLTVRYRDSAASVSVKGKPYGVKFVQIFGRASATPITVQDATSLLTQLTKSPGVLNLAGMTTGQQVYFWARYLLANGQFSAWSTIVNFTVANSM